MLHGEAFQGTCPGWMPNKAVRGFTLVELLAVIAVMAIVAAMARRANKRGTNYLTNINIEMIRAQCLRFRSAYLCFYPMQIRLTAENGVMS